MRVNARAFSAHDRTVTQTDIAPSWKRALPAAMAAVMSIQGMNSFQIGWTKENAPGGEAEGVFGGVVG